MQSVNVHQLQRQSLWLRESWLWLLREKILKTKARPSALEVGCGPGFIMEIVRPLVDVQGVDIDQDMVEMAMARDFSVIRAPAEHLPFDDQEFDIVYCSFLLLWLENPVAAVKEMKRVSRDWVVCLAEPDYGGRIDHPDGLGVLSKILADNLIKEGADPFVGRKLREIFFEAGLNAEVGVHPGVWDLNRLWKEFKDESMLLEGSSAPDLKELKAAWEESIDNHTIFQYNPVFYALARK